MYVNKYKKLMVDFLEEKLSADEFQTQYFKVFKESDDIMAKPLFEILNGVFESADCYWHECLSGEETTFEISEQQLRKEINEALINLLSKIPPRDELAILIQLTGALVQ